VSKVTVLLFASYADRFGASTLEVPVSPGDTVQDLVGSIRTQRGFETLPRSPRVAVNRKFATDDQLINPTDEIALIPPVAGG
jgi:molybdopterin converting factor subunit 1